MTSLLYICWVLKVTQYVSNSADFLLIANGVILLKLLKVTNNKTHGDILIKVLEKTCPTLLDRPSTVFKLAIFGKII
jgi:hypothetical protein